MAAMCAIAQAQTLLLVLLLFDVIDTFMLHFFLECVAFHELALLFVHRVDLRFYFECWDEAAVFA